MAQRGGCLQHLWCEISIQGRIRERLFYKDGQIELYRRSTLLEEEEDSKARAREKRNDRGETGLAPSHALATSRGRSIGDIVVPNVSVAGCNERCNGHVVKLLGRLNRRDVDATLGRQRRRRRRCRRRRRRR